MNKICYELEQIQVIKVDGTHYPISLDIVSPTLIIPEEAISVVSYHEYFEVEKGQYVILQQAGCIQICSTKDGQAAQVICLSFHSYQLVEKTDTRMIYEKGYEWLPKHGSICGLPRRVHALLDSIVQQSKIELAGSVSARLHAMMNEFLYSIFERAPIDPSQAIDQQDSIHAVLSYLHIHYNDPIKRSDIANMIGFNSSYFSSLFRKKTGWSFNEYVNRLRLEEAKRLLLSTSDTYHEIASKVGLLDGNYLGKNFRRVFQIAPSKYRELRHAARIAALQFPGALLAIDIVPVAVSTEVLCSSQLIAEELDSVEKINVFESLEGLKSVRPDVIIAPTYLYNFPRLIKEIEQIAPTIMLEWGVFDKLEEVQIIGRLLGREQQAEQWIDSYIETAKRARQWKNAHIPEHKTAAIYEQWRETTWMIPHITVRSAYNLYTSIGFNPPASIAIKSEQLKDHLVVSEAELMDYCADYMFIIMPVEDHELFLASIHKSNVWSTLISKGINIYLLDFYQFWLDEGVLLEKQLNVMMEHLSQGAWSKQISL